MPARACKGQSLVDYNNFLKPHNIWSYNTCKLSFCESTKSDPYNKINQLLSINKEKKELYFYKECWVLEGKQRKIIISNILA